MTRTPDAHFYTEVRYKGTKTVAVSSDYGEMVKFSDVWLAPRQGTDAALALAMGHVVLLGRKTWESIGRPLPGRRMVVISRQSLTLPEGVELAASLDEAIARHATEDEIMVMGDLELNKSLLEFLTQKRIILHFFNYHGYYAGTYYPREHMNSGAVLLA